MRNLVSLGRSAAILLAVLAGLMAASGVPAFADKLVLFKNGKSMRAKAVKIEGGWTRLELDGGGLMAVKSGQVRTVEDAISGGAVKADLPNQASVGGGGGGYVGGGYSPRAEDNAPIPEEDAQPAEPVAQPPAGAPGIPSAVPAPASNRGFRRFGRNGGALNPSATPREPISGPDGSLKGPVRDNQDDDD